MKINTVRFGEIDIEKERIFNFTLPIIGFDELKEFVILDINKDSFTKRSINRYMYIHRLA